MKKSYIAVLCLVLSACFLLSACGGDVTDPTTTAAATVAPTSVLRATVIPTDYPDYFSRKEDSEIGLGFKIGLKASTADALLKQKPVAWIDDLENVEDDFGRTLCIWKLEGLTMKYQYTEEEVAAGITLGKFEKDLTDILYAAYAGSGKCVYIEVYQSVNDYRFTLLRGLECGTSTKEQVKAAFPETTGADATYFYKGQFAEKEYTHDAFGKETTFEGADAYLYVYPVDNQADELVGTDGEVYRSVYFVFDDAGVISRMVLQQSPWDAAWDQ